MRVRVRGYTQGMSHLFSLSSRVAFVTGGSRGIGRTIAQGLARAGADIVVVSRSKEDIEKTANELHHETGRKVLGLECDVTSKTSVDNALQKTLEAFSKVDILVNNAGVAVRKNTLTLTEAEWDLVIDTNVKSVFLVSQAIGKHMARRKYGRILNIASVASEITLGHTTPYGPSKAAVVQLTRQLASEWARFNITVNALSPWYFKTEINRELLETEEFMEKIKRRTPMGRVGNLEELVVFFCSEGASFVTGQNLFVDGGATKFGF